jgi:hypothetical protein
MYQFTLLMVFISLLCSCQSEKPTCQSKENIYLLDTIFQSHTTIDEFQTRYSYLNTTEIQNKNQPPIANCEGYSLATITAIYKHHDIDGQLLLKFHNNELCSISFFPKDSSTYLNNLCQKSNLCLSNNKELFKNKALIRTANIPEKGFAVIWEDNCMMQKLNEFLTKCPQ